MWGKLTERNIRTLSRIIKEPKNLHGFLSTPGVQVTNLVFVSDDVVWIVWKYGAEEHVPSLHHTNEVIGVYVTAGARIHLYRYLDQLETNAMYCDIDSVIYIQPEAAQQLIETGNILGEMTSELRPSESISEFACRGPKNYAYRLVDSVTGTSKAVCKVRGITLNYSASKLVNFDVVKYMILKGDEHSLINVHAEHKIKRKRKWGSISIVTEPKEKIYRISFFKRRRLGENTSVLFGYK